MSPKRIAVQSSAGPYSVLCGFNRAALKNEIARLGEFSSTHIISSRKVWRALGASDRSAFAVNKPALHLFDDAEARKNLSTVETLCRSLTRSGADRHSLLVAVGGGVTGDVSGYVAASYLRGVALVHIPTTVVSQVDSAIGGKTGVNLPEGKNLVGAFFSPRLVLADPRLLRTLPDREFRGGLAEVIKYGIIADEKLFRFLEKNWEKILSRDHLSLVHIITRSIEIKARVVSQDERESGLREILNYGHTFGHALESITKYRRYQHGEAVAWGMMAAAHLGHELKCTSPDTVARIIALIRRIGPLPKWPQATPTDLINAMRSDKKARAGRIRFVLSARIGKAASYDSVPLEAVERVLHYTPLLEKKNALPPEAVHA
ncbi:MAG TPA: 3-dehydroquinate synthase [Candidatus Saccharimonadales bacterium]|nr:3-dehydroquinate synthase [Candidatus Saccharimonadales bacterium]